MAQLFYELQKYRFFLIVGGVLLSLFTAKTLLWSTPLQISTLSDVRAGDSPSVTVTADSSEDLTLTLTKPDDSQITLTATTKDDGKTKVTLPSEELTQAGDYTLSAGRWYSKSKASETFTVEAGKASVTHSRVSFSQSSLLEGQTAQMVILLADEYGNPVSGHALTVTPNQSSVQVYSSEFATNEKGQINFSVSGNGTGVVAFSLFDSTEGENVLGQPQLAFAGSSNGSVQLASSGPIASFGVTGLSAETLASTQQSVTVKALDSDGFTVTDYTGTIRFSSSDSEASLPDDYSFTADDQGEHTFSLSVKLITPGTQTVSVTDTDHTSYTGSESTSVVTSLSTSSSNSSSTDHNSSFETTDFTRDGDFTLISPASGTYSSDTIEVQGEGEYGNTAVVMVNDEEAGRTDIAFDNSFSYTVQDVKDGDYAVYVNIVDKDEKILETSTAEAVSIDTTAPNLVSVSADPDSDIAASSKVTITVLSESDLESAAILFQDQVNAMTETNTPGKYQVDLVMPATEGDYSLDVDLSDTLGNEATYRDQLKLTVGAGSAVAETPVTPVETSSTVTGLTASGAEEKVALSWETPTSASTIAYYRIYYGPSPDALFAVSETYDSSTTWTIPELTANQSYYFAIAAVDVEGTEGPQSEAVVGVPTLALVSTVTTPVVTTPAITEVQADISSTPESGPAENALVALSIAGALAYVLLRKRARA